MIKFLLLCFISLMYVGIAGSVAEQPQPTTATGGLNLIDEYNTAFTGIGNWYTEKPSGTQPWKEPDTISV
jgi:hypothetical protein